MPSQVKEAMVRELIERVGQLRDCTFVDFAGLNAEQAVDLRRTLHDTGSRMLVVRNTLVRRALPQEAVRALGDALTGSTAVAYGSADPSVMLKALMDWGKKNRALALKGGLIDGRAMLGDELRQVADLPPQDVLRARLLGTLTAPMTGLLRLLNEPRRRLVAILSQKLKKEADGAEATPA